LIMRSDKTSFFLRQLGCVLPSSRSAARLLLAGALSVGCASSSTSDIQVRTAADSKASLSGYKSFAWFASASVLHDRTGVWVPKDVDTQSEVEFLVDKGLREHGLSVAQEHPDLFVSLMIVADVRDVQEIQQSRGEGLSTFDPVGKGALLVELIDAETGKTVWLGGAQGDVRQSRSSDESKQRLAYAVDQIFAQLPR
jgi:hypothetical protein